MRLSADSSLMWATGIEGGKGPLEALRTVQIPRPIPGQGEILIEVASAGLNRADLIQREGKYPPPPGAPETLGLEVAGRVVVAAGRWRVGDEVCALLGGGGYAQFAVCDARHALPIPKGIALQDAAAFPETVFTVFANVFEHAGLKPGETFMVHGATSGIGATAIEMAKACGARVIATARGADKAKAALALGADVAVDASSEDFAEAAKAAGGCDVILCMVGGDYFGRNLDVLKTGGRIVHVATQAGGRVELNLNKLMTKRAVVTGSTLRARPADEKARIAAAVEQVVWPWIEAGKVKPNVYRAFPLRSAAEAHACLDGDHVGKVLLTLPPA